jgi:hypothetical protein
MPSGRAGEAVRDYRLEIGQGPSTWARLHNFEQFVPVPERGAGGCNWRDTILGVAYAHIWEGATLGT